MTAAQDVRFALRQMAAEAGICADCRCGSRDWNWRSNGGLCGAVPGSAEAVALSGSREVALRSQRVPERANVFGRRFGFDYSEIKQHTKVFDSSGIYFYNDLNLTGAGDARHVDVVNASASPFDTLAI